MEYLSLLFWFFLIPIVVAILLGLITWIPAVNRLFNAYRYWSFKSKIYEKAKSNPLIYGNFATALRRAELEKKKANIQKQIDKH